MCTELSTTFVDKKLQGQRMTTPLTNWPTFADSKNYELLAALKRWGENRNGHGIITRTELVADLST